jgi:ribosomal protein L19E
LGDKSTTTRNVEGAQRQTFFWFNEDDIQELVAATLKDGIDRLIADTMIEQKGLRPAR